MALVAFDILRGGQPLARSPNALETILFLIAAYVTGHLVAALSSLLLERGIVNKLLGAPTGLLLDIEPPKPVARLLRSYSSSLPAGVRERILDNAKEQGVSQDPRSLFLYGFSEAKNRSSTFQRFGTFVALYGFSRNMTISSLIAACSFLSVGDRLLAAAATVAAVGLFFRYLKFYRLSAQEVILEYLILKKE